MTKEENKRIGEALFEIYKIPQTDRGRLFNSISVKTTSREKVLVMRI